VVSTSQKSSCGSFDPDTGSIAAARRFVRRVLASWAVDELMDDALVLVSELATNAVVHAGTPFGVTCTDLGDGVRLEVRDRYPARGLPAVLPAVDQTRPTGRGLLLCASLSSAWGVEYTRTAKTVWCRLDLAGRSVTASSPSEDLPPGPVLVAVVGTDVDGAIRDWNADAEALLGWTTAAVRGRSLADLTPDGTLPAGVEERTAAGTVCGHTACGDTASGDTASGDTASGDTASRETASWDLLTAASGTAAAEGGRRRWQGGLIVRHADGHPVPVYAVRQSGRGGAGDPSALWLLVPVAQRAALVPAPAAVTASDAGWAPLTDGDLVRLRLEDMLQRAIDRACDAFRADAAYLLVASLDGADSQLATSGLPERRAPLAALPPPVAAALTAGGVPAVYDDLTETTPVPLLAGTALQSAIVAPLLAESRPIGQLCVASARSGHFGKDDAVRLQHAADRLALSVEARRVADLTRRHRDQLGYLAEASDLLAGTLDPQMTLAMLAQLLVPRLAAWCALWVRDARGLPTISYVWHADESRLDAVQAALDGMLAAPAGPAQPPDGAASARFRVDVPDLASDLAVALPLRARGHPLGTAVLGRPGGAWFEQDALELAEDLSRRAALALDNALLYRTQLATSRALQRSLLPAALPTVPGLEVGVAYEAAGEGLDAGGDFYDVFAVDEQRWRFAVGDVSGNGPEAAAVTGLARHALHLLARQDRPLAEAVAQLNQAILDHECKARFLTVLHGEITLRPAGGVRVALVAAGHPLPFLVEPTGRVRTIGTFGPLLGVLDQVDHVTEVVHLVPGEAMVCVTDGVLERRNAGRTLGEDDIGPLLAGCAGLSAAATAAALRRAVIEYAPLPPRDDMAILVLRTVAANPGRR
jgi:serine phosphatase RsbU (regulator of sigma subunit)/anti-sigma regulatory factor (Ser/Thr protein kinase)